MIKMACKLKSCKNLNIQLSIKIVLAWPFIGNY